MALTIKNCGFNSFSAMNLFNIRAVSAQAQELDSW